jgi:hypothetical protein
MVGRGVGADVAVAGGAEGAGSMYSGGAGIAVTAETTAIGVPVGRAWICAVRALQLAVSSATTASAVPCTQIRCDTRESIIILQSITFDDRQTK